MHSWQALFHPRSERNGHESLQRALALLSRAREYAQQVRSDAWQFAVEIEELRQLGLTNCDFRWLVARGYVAHALETTLPGEEQRQFTLLGRHMFPDGTCFILHTGMDAAAPPQEEDLSDTEEDDTRLETNDDPTTTGNGSVKETPVPPFVQGGSAGETNSHSASPDRRAGETHGTYTKILQPHWDPRRRELRVGDKLVKRFRWPAVNQETVLAVFEEEGWPDRVDDPLPVVPEQDPKRRLHDTIKCLNRNQLHEIVHFRGDGTGEGVSWELVECRE
jgi:hypothetical protein